MEFVIFIVAAVVVAAIAYPVLRSRTKRQPPKRLRQPKAPGTMGRER